MKKKLFLVCAVVLALAFAVVAGAYVTNKGNDQHIFNRWKFWENTYFGSGTTMDVNGTLDITGATVTGTSVVTGTNIVDVTRAMPLPLGGFVVETSGSTYAELTTSTTPGFEYDDVVPAIVWGDGEASPVAITFRVPDDYSSGGAFRVFATESNANTVNQIDFEVYVNADATAADSSATDQTPAALDQNTSTGCEVTLTVATDFGSLAAGNWVTLRVWRDDVADGDADLEIKGVDFYYESTQ